MSTVDTNEFHSRELNLQIHSYTSNQMYQMPNTVSKKFPSHTTYIAIPSLDFYIVFYFITTRVTSYRYK